MLTEQDLHDLSWHPQTKVLFVIGAVRFSDSNGEHEAHACAWLAATDVNFGNGGTLWQNCRNYKTQVDIR